MGTPRLYEQIVWELRKEIYAQGLTMSDCDDRSGNPDGYTAKALHPDTKSGREATWLTLEALFRVVYPEGFKTRIKPVGTIMLNGLSTVDKYRTKYGNGGQIAIRDFARFAGQQSAKARAQRIPPSRRRAIAKKAAKARWSRVSRGERLRS